MPNLAKFLKIKLLTIYVLLLLNPLTCDLHNFVKIHFQIKPPSAHLHFQWSFHPELHFGGIWGFWKTGWSIQAKRTVWYSIINNSIEIALNAPIKIEDCPFEKFIMHHFDTLNLLDSHLGELTIFLKDSFEILNGDMVMRDCVIAWRSWISMFLGR